MTDNDIVAWIIVIAIIGLVCVVLGAWNWWQQFKQRKETMRQFWRR